MKITCTAVVLLIQTFCCLASDDSSFELTNKATGFCLVKRNNYCYDIRWTTGDRLLVQQLKKCLGAQGKNVGSEINLYDCDETSEFQKWECKNETVLALKGQELYVELTADNTAVLSKTVGPNNHLTISGMSSGACSRTYRELFTIGGNAFGKPCMFPFLYKDQWYSNCTTFDTSEKRLWCAVETKYESERWGYCPTTSRGDWNKHPSTGAYYQLNTQSALTWPQAEISCKQQGSSLLSISDPHEQAYITALLWKGGNTLWIGLVLDPEHGWKWSNGRPYRYLKWDSGHPLPDPGHNCAVADPAVQYTWQSSPCSKKLGYICYSKGAEERPTQAVGTGLCSAPWIPYNGHCFHLNRTQKTWSDAQKQCRDERGDLVSIRNVEDQSFVISQLGYASTDELWIGLNDRKTEGLFDWTDHSTVSFTSWEYGKPDVSAVIKDCVLIRGENGNWADRVCEEKHGFICMKTSSSTSSGDKVEKDEGCKSGWRRHGSYCYFIGRETKSFHEAKDDCKSSDSYLADISSGVDNAFLVSLVGNRPEKYFWLGLSNQKNFSQFVWTNTYSVRFTHWNAEMPGHRQGCVAMKTGIFAGLWDVLPCTNKEKYICKHQAEGTVLTPAPPTLVPPKCAYGWNRLGAGNRCFKLFSQSNERQRTWYEARDYCKAIGGDLLSIHSREELNDIPRSYVTAWIGLSAPDPDTGYVWSDGSPVNFQHWAEGEPNNKMNIESCVVHRLHERWIGSWEDVHCELSRDWLCQIRAGVTPNPPPAPVTPDYNQTSDGWLEWKGNQYYFNHYSSAMEDARAVCKRKHSDLVTINSEAENVFLWKQIARFHSSVWIGMTVDLDNTFAWMDDSPVVFQRWDENQPNFRNNDENCVVMTTSLGFWRNRNCGFDSTFICKRSNSPPANASQAPPTVPPTGGCPQNWEKFNSKCYRVINNQNETWEGARTQCKTMGGNLVSIVSKDVQGFLSSKLFEAPTTNLWIGLHAQNDAGRFYWTDGRPNRYSNWGFESNLPHRLHHLPHRFNPYEDYPWQRRIKKECVIITTNTDVGIGKWLKRSCNDTNGYICLRKLDSSLPDSNETRISTDYVKIFNDSIKIVTQPMNWDEAKKYCENDGANLASLRNKWTQLYVSLMAMKLNSPLWIGLNSKQTDGYFRYIDGWHLTLTDWDQREPRMTKPCVYVKEDGKWKTAYCMEKMNSVCMKSTDVPPTESSDFPGFCPEDPETAIYSRERTSWLSFKAYCYLFITDRSNWPDASANCVRHGGSLASIENPAEQAFITNVLQQFRDIHSVFWIGLFKTHRGQWKWLDKTPTDYTNWIDDDDPFGQYGQIRTLDGTWTANRMSRCGYICKTLKVKKRAPPTTEGSLKADPQTHSHIVLEVLLSITVIAIGAVIIFLLLKKYGVRLSLPQKLTTFDNPLFFNNERSQAGVVDTNQLVANVEN
ncbi:macrophage mannose receptor 1-like isoform X2 [Amphiprion ocellaris]|uniref:macrophage mannose receptor 1-like isoform X2 n=1 Tax=Amphiprion ocellaris TaxID=80972 RepID=UPI0024118E66|nr:macrophage mannose receptor 1-like isoform X2 [Amphiprion ocellaris]